MTTKTKKVAPIPRGFRSITPHIATPDVTAALDLYIDALGATLVSTETAPHSDIVVFALLKIGNSQLTLGQGDPSGAGAISLHLYVEDIDATWSAAVFAGFTERAAIQETYWGDRMGILVDPLGVCWSVAQRVLHLTAEERSDRARAATDPQTPEPAIMGDVVLCEAAIEAAVSEQAPTTEPEVLQ